MRVLLTGMAGFIGAHLGARLASDGIEVAGIDNLNNYYSPRLKTDRLKELCGISFSEGEPHEDCIYKSATLPGLTFELVDLADTARMKEVFNRVKPQCVVNLAAQAGVRYSLEAPADYIRSNIDGFLNILEGCRGMKEQPRLVYASSSSVYGDNTSVPFHETDRVDLPASLYAATKRSDELMARVYSKLFGLRCIGLRFFTVYGPWGRPDMSMMLFATAMSQGKPIKMFNHGRMSRDFTYIDDIVEGVARIVERPEPEGAEANRIYNIGHGSPVGLADYVDVLGRAMGIEPKIDMLPMQPGDVESTWADTTALEHDYGYRPATTLEQGLERFARWFKAYS